MDPLLLLRQGMLGTLLLAGGLFLGNLAATHREDASHVLMEALASPQTAVEAENNRPSEAGVFVHLEEDDRALLVEALVDQRQKVRLILDTGATYTAISQEMAQQLGYDTRNCPHVLITTANGQVSLPKVTIRELSLNGYTARNVEATVMPLPKNMPFSGLLGLNFIRHHRITIDTEAAHLVIAPSS